MIFKQKIFMERELGKIKNTVDFEEESVDEYIPSEPEEVENNQSKKKEHGKKLFHSGN